MFNVPMIRKDRDNQLFRFDSLFDDFFKAPFSLTLGEVETLPAVDVYEKGDKIIVRAEIPGVKSEELNVSVDNDLLTISGEKKQENEVKEKDYYRLESAYGRFERTLRLPDAVKAEAAKATHKNGVLTIELPRAEDTKKKKLKIDVE